MVRPTDAMAVIFRWVAMPEVGVFWNVSSMRLEGTRAMPAMRPHALTASIA